MGTALIYLLVVAVVAAVVFLLASLVFGRGEELAPLSQEATPTRLPSAAVRGDDVRDLRFRQVVRGYRMGEVDWVLDRLAEELDTVSAERDRAATERDRAATERDRAAAERDELAARVRELEEQS